MSDRPLHSRAAEHSPRLMLLPLIDIFMVLLVIVMVTMPALYQGVAVDVPATKTHDQSPGSTELQVSVDLGGKLYLNGTAISKEALLTVVREQAPRCEGVVYVYADKKLAYGMVISVVDSLKAEAGVRHVILATRRERRAEK